MTAAIVSLGTPRDADLARELEREGVRIVAIVPPHRLADADLASADVLLVPPRREVLTPSLLDACDRAAVRIVALGTGESRYLARLGLPEPLPEDIAPWRLAALLAEDAPAPAPQREVEERPLIVVWGPPGSPGRSTLAIQLAVELRRRRGSCALVDADTVAPALALLLGLDDDAPGIAAACRRAELGGLDANELGRISVPLETSAGTIDVLGGLNRPARWPEISSSRLATTLRACRTWTAATVVDVAAPFDAEEEIADDRLHGPRRHAATASALQEADVVVAVASADPLSISRFIREYGELRRLVGAQAPIVTAVNRVRPGPLGIDARGQVRRSLERFAGIASPVFLPHDLRATDAALLHARPLADVTPRAPLASAVRRLADAISPAPVASNATADTRRGSSRAARWLGSARAARAGSPPGSDPVSAS